MHPVLKNTIRIILWISVIVGAVITFGFIQVYLTYTDDGVPDIEFWAMVVIEVFFVLLIYLLRPWK